MAPVAQGIEVAHEQALVKSRIDPRQAPGDFTSHKRFATTRALVVEQNAVAGIHPVAFAVVHRDPVGIELCYAIGAARIKRRALLLGNFLHQAIELTGAGLVDPRFVCEPQDAHSLQDPQRAQRITIGCVFRALKTHRNMALSAKVVNLIGLHLLDDPDQVGAVGEVAVVEHQPRITFMRVLVEMIDPTGVEAARTPLDPMHLIPLLQQQLRQVATVLTGDACDQGGFGRGGGH